MELIIYILDQEPFEVKVTKINRPGSINDYQFKHPKYKGFQFDGYHRPTHYLREQVENHTFRGYILGKTGVSNEECLIKIKNYGVDV